MGKQVTYQAGMKIEKKSPFLLGFGSMILFGFLKAIETYLECQLGMSGCLFLVEIRICLIFCLEVWSTAEVPVSWLQGILSSLLAPFESLALSV